MEQEKIILQKYEPLIYKVAKNFYNVELCDLYQAGSLGLIKAYRNYNENVGKNFINFAYMYIYGEMFEFVNNSQTIKLNKEYLRLSKSIKNTFEYSDARKLKISCFCLDSISRLISSSRLLESNTERISPERLLIKMDFVSTQCCVPSGSKYG